MNIREFDRSYKKRLSDFYASAFYEEHIYCSNLDLAQEDLKVIYGNMLDILLRYPGNKVVGCEQNGKILSAGVLASPDWLPNAFVVLAKQLSMFLRLGPKKSYRVAKYLYSMPPVNVPGSWHLILLATDSEHRNNGYAGQILSSCYELASMDKGKGIYLEALKNSFAQDFYKGKGFEVFNENYTQNFCVMYLPVDEQLKKAA